MTAQKEFATQIGALAVGSTAFALGDPSGGTLLATPLAALAALGLTLKSGCADKACAKAEAKVLALLAQNPEYTPEDIERARAILKDAPDIAKLDPKEVTAHIHGKDIERELTRLIMAPLGIGEDDDKARDIIRTALVSGIAICKQDMDFRAALTLELVLETARKQGIEIGILQRVETKVDDMGGKLNAILAGHFVSLGDMKALAAEFGAHDIADQGSLDTFLKLKAQEYIALKTEVDAIDDGLIRLSNLKTAAQDAIARVNLDEVEELLSRVQEVELEEAAKTAELRANNALLRGRVEQAYRILCAAADSFAAVDPLEPARRCTHAYSEMLIRHGMRYGGAGLPIGAEMSARLLSDELQKQSPLLWAAGKNHLAIALQEQGIRTDGPKGATLLAETVDAYRAALEVRTRADHPEQWAMTQNNLANTLQSQGARTDGPKGAALLAEAVDAYRAALEVRTRADHPVQWAMTQNNLASALSNQAVHTDVSKGTALLAEAVDAYRAALEVYTLADHPVNWAGAQNNLAATLRNQGSRTDGQTGATLLAEAVDVYRAALEVYTRTDHPVDWAMTQENIAIALLDRSKRPETDAPRKDLRAALEAVDRALEVYNPEHMSYNHKKATNLRADIQAALDALPN